MEEQSINIQSTGKAIFKPRTWLSHIDFINHLVIGNNILISILAETQGGKTTFANLLRNQLDVQIKPYLLTINQLFNKRVFIKQFADQLYSSEELSELSSIIEFVNRSKTFVLIIIDDAQYLPIEFIDEMLHESMTQGEDGYFHVCLISNDELLPALKRLSTTHNDRIHCIELGALNELETKPYLLGRMQHEKDIKNRLSDEKIKHFYELTEGSLVGINTQYSDFFKIQPKKSFFNRNVLNRLSLVSTFVIAVISATYLWQPIPGTVVLDLPKQTISGKRIINQEDSLVQLSEIPAYSIRAVRQALESTQLRRAELVADNLEDSLNSTLVVMDKVVVIPKIITRNKQKKSKTLVHAELAPIQKSFIHPAVTMQKQARSFAADFTIQLMASRSKKSIEQFAKKNHIKNDAKIFRTQKNGISWYVLTVGQYEKRLGALNAVNKLPKEVVKIKPWVRSLSELKTLG